MNIIDIRFEIHQIIAKIKPLDMLEKQHIHFALDWIQSGSEIFRIEKPATPDTHLGAYFVVFDPEKNQILLVDHKKALLWLPTGGHVELGENPKETVRREIKEELRIKAEFLFEDPVFCSMAKTIENFQTHTDVSLWYLLKGDVTQVLNYDLNEFHQIQWFEIDSIPFKKSDPHLKRFLQKIKTSLNCFL